MDLIIFYCDGYLWDKQLTNVKYNYYTIDVSQITSAKFLFSCNLQTWEVAHPSSPVTKLILLDWNFLRGTLIEEANGTVYQKTDQGLLSVIFVNRLTGEEINHTVCADNFNWRTAKTFCRNFGFEQGYWGSEQMDSFKFVSRWVLKCYTNRTKT